MVMEEWSLTMEMCMREISKEVNSMERAISLDMIITSIQETG